MGEIKKLYDMDIQGENRPYWIFPVLAPFLGVASLCLITHFAKTPLSDLASALAAIIPTGLLLMIYGSLTVGEAMKREFCYQKYLATLPLNVLEAASASPKLDNQSQKSVMRFLNRQEL